MNLFAMMETSGGAMQAERMRAEVVAANMANAETTRTAAGGVYHRQHVVFAANAGDSGFADSMNAASGAVAAGTAGTLGTGTLVSGTLSPLTLNGYVSYPDINPLTEMVDLMGATRAYGLNSSAVQAEKGMISSALEIAKS